MGQKDRRKDSGLFWVHGGLLVEDSCFQSLKEGPCDLRGTHGAASPSSPDFNSGERALEHPCTVLCTRLCSRGLPWQRQGWIPVLTPWVI